MKDFFNSLLKSSGDGSTKIAATMTKCKSWMDHPRSLDADWPPRQPTTIADLVAEARTVEWNFTGWCNASGYEASDPDTRQMFECLLAYARSEGRNGLN